ncbi:hypothetical protein GJ744_003147 [Endocarpon pusillum]|uniref:Uncharacterized protein n=1 Tax=Endocarpon pusillum TaxID=364733 RepID=A0A8H7E657_9EURO|nr:hypothetical protein GJ744_003147 [Endocarpon pusillum]
MRSCKATSARYNKLGLFLRLLCAYDRAAGLYLPTGIQATKHTYGDDFAANGKAVYAKHLALVRKKMSDVGRLNENEYLEFNVKEGWEPLCKFLRKEVPKDVEGKPKPFPHVNDRATLGQSIAPYFAALFQKLLWQTGTVVVAIAVMAGALWLGSENWAKVFEGDKSF